MKPTAVLVKPPMGPMLHGTWLWFLLLRGASNSDCRKHLEVEDLPCPDGATLDLLRETRKPPKGFKPGSKNKATQSFCEQHGLLDWFEKTPLARQAVRVLHIPRAREVVESAAILNVPPRDVANLLSQLKTPVSPEGVVLYQRTFFNSQVASHALLRVLVRERVAFGMRRFVGAADDPHLRRAIASDLRMKAFSLPRSSLGFRVLLKRLGIRTAPIDLAKSLDELESLATASLTENLYRSGQRYARLAESGASVLEKLRNLRDKLADPDDAIAKFAKIAIECDESPMKTVEQLVAEKGGSWTDGRIGTPDWKCATGSSNDTIEG